MAWICAKEYKDTYVQTEQYEPRRHNVKMYVSAVRA